jgi:F-type H+-transporting ATPase subunit alpha
MAFVGELFGIGLTCVSRGVVVNLYRDNTSAELMIGAIMVNPSLSDRITQGTMVKGIGSSASVKLGTFAVGSLLDPLGSCIFSSTSMDFKHLWLIEQAAPSIISRLSIHEPVQTGLICIDAMIPIGRGQRELVVGDRQTGKTSIGMDTILNQRTSAVICVYNAIGQKASSILDLFVALVSRDAIFYSSVLMATAADSAVSQYLSAYTGTSLISTSCTCSRCQPTFIMLDDLSKHAVSYREIYLLLRRPLHNVRLVKLLK